MAAEQGIRQFVGPKFLLAALYTQMNDKASALQVYQEIQELEPKMSDKMPTTFAEARMKAADLKLKSLQLTEGQPLEESHMKVIGQAIEDLTVASEIAPRLSGPKIELAKVLLKLGRTSESADLLNQVLSEDKTNVEAMLVTAEALVQSGNPSYAAAQLVRLIEIKPDHFEARLMLGRLLVQIGRKDDAVRELQALVRMQPKNESAKSLLQQITGSTTRPTTQTSGG
jgi:cytochrome c-type biogenesis protein CcmH/NrfG